MVTSGKGELHDGWSCVSRILFQSRWKPQFDGFGILLVQQRTMPRVCRDEEQTMISENAEQLLLAEAHLYRRMVMKLAHVAQDRIDIAVAVKCFTRYMKEPRSGHMVEVRTSGRHLIKNKRCVPDVLATDIGRFVARARGFRLGPRLARKDVYDRCIDQTRPTLVVTHVVFANAFLRCPAVRSCGLIRGACASQGIQSHDQDWLIDVPINTCSDSSTARIVARRRGPGGRLTHLRTLHLWLQSRIALGVLKLDAFAGESNPAHESAARSQDSRAVKAR